MIKVETIDGKIAVKSGKATGADLICEASAVVVSVIGAAIKKCKSEKAKAELAKEVFVQITGAGGEIEERTGIDVFAPLSNDADNDEEEDEADDEEETIIAKAIPMDSETGRKLMELLGIDSEEVKSGDDDETEDDIPKFLF